MTLLSSHMDSYNLTPEQLESYDNNGFLKIEGVKLTYLDGIWTSLPMVILPIN